MALSRPSRARSRAVLVVCDGVSNSVDSDVASLAAARAAARRAGGRRCPAGTGTVAAQVAATQRRSRSSAAATRPTTARHRAHRRRTAPTRPRARSSPRCVDGRDLGRRAGSATAAAYWLPDARRRQLQLTIDDSFAHEQIAAGVPRAEAETGPQAHAITRWLGRRRAATIAPRPPCQRRPAGLAAGLLRRAVELLLGARRTLAGAAATTTSRCARRRAARRWPGRSSPGPTPRAASDNITVALARVAHPPGRCHAPTQPTSADAEARPPTHREEASPRWLSSPLTVYQNEFLPDGGTDVHAIVTVTCTGAGAAGQTGGGRRRRDRHRRHVRLDGRRSTIGGRQAGRAGGAGRDRRRHLVRRRSPATTRRDLAYPPATGPAHGARWTRRPGRRPGAPCRALRARTAARPSAPGSTWPARCSPRSRRLAQRHAILLTDGENQTRRPSSSTAAIAAGHGASSSATAAASGSTGRSRRSAGSPRPCWAPSTSSPSPSRWPPIPGDDAGSRWRRGVADAELRVWAPQGAQVLFVRQVAPTVEDLTARRAEVNALTGGYPTGAWGDESRDYHVAVRLAAKAVGQEQLAARVQLAIGERGGRPRGWSRRSGPTTTP